MKKIKVLIILILVILILILAILIKNLILNNIMVVFIKSDNFKGVKSRGMDIFLYFGTYSDYSEYSKYFNIFGREFGLFIFIIFDKIRADYSNENLFNKRSVFKWVYVLSFLQTGFSTLAKFGQICID
jgi:hypothetical protein